MTPQGGMDRLTQLRQYLYTHGQSTIQDLAQMLGASLATIRRDLNQLEAEGYIERVHGGARIAGRAGTELSFELRENKNLAQKRLIAGVAYKLLRPGSTVFLDNGTTVLQLAKRIRLEPLAITVYTDGLRVAQELAGLPGVNVAMLGGQLNAESMSLLGPAAEAALADLWFDQLFMGVNAVGPDGRIYSLDLAGASLNQRMLARCSERYIVADSSKFERLATHAVAPLSDVTCVITDDQLAASSQRRLLEIGVQLRLAESSVAQGKEPAPD